MKFARTLGFGVIAVVALALAATFSTTAEAQSRKAPQVRVYLLRGLANIFSFGMDDLATKLNARGIKATVHSYVDWQTLSATAEEDARAGKRRPTPVVIIGHSLGADAAVYMGNKVAGAGVPVPLVVTFDPVTPTTASAKIGKVVNYYQAGGSGKAVSGPRVQNIDLTGQGSLSHFNIEKAADLHQRVIAMIEAPARKPVRRTAPAPQAAAPAPTASTLAPTTPTETAAAPGAAAVVPAAVRTPN